MTVLAWYDWSPGVVGPMTSFEEAASVSRTGAGSRNECTKGVPFCVCEHGFINLSCVSEIPILLP